MSEWKAYVGMLLTAAGLALGVYGVLSARAEKREAEIRELRERVIVLETQQRYSHGDLAVASKGN